LCCSLPFVGGGVGRGGCGGGGGGLLGCDRIHNHGGAPFCSLSFPLRSPKKRIGSGDMGPVFRFVFSASRFCFPFFPRFLSLPFPLSGGGETAEYPMLAAFSGVPAPLPFPFYLSLFLPFFPPFSLGRCVRDVRLSDCGGPVFSLPFFFSSPSFFF